MKTLTFSFEDALLSAEGLAILSGAELIPARDKNLKQYKGIPEADTVIAHTTERFTVTEQYNPGSTDPEVAAKPLNIALSKKPFIGKGGDIYVMLLDNGGEMSGAPIQVNLNVSGAAADLGQAYIQRFAAGDKVNAYDKSGKKVTIGDTPADGTFWDAAAAVGAVYFTRATNGDITLTDGDALIGEPVATGIGVTTDGFTSFNYEGSIPSLKKGDTVLIDYYVEYKHDAVQVSIKPEVFAPFMYVEGSSLVRRASDGQDLPCEFVIPKFKITTALTFTLQSTGDASTFTFQGDAYADYTKFDTKRKVLANIQILDADDNYDMTGGEATGDPTKYTRYQYDDNDKGEYLWKNPEIEEHANIDYTDENQNMDTLAPSGN